MKGYKLLSFIHRAPNAATHGAAICWARVQAWSWTITHTRYSIGEAAHRRDRDNHAGTLFSCTSNRHVDLLPPGPRDTPHRQQSPRPDATNHLGRAVADHDTRLANAKCSALQAGVPANPPRILKRAVTEMSDTSRFPPRWLQYCSVGP